MTGYLSDATATRQAICDGWFITGRLATMNDDGFITLCPKCEPRREPFAANQ
jgi:long-subunit acyl-CoA synthetase (AMP-forming)